LYDYKMTNLAGPFHQLFCIVNSGEEENDLFKSMGYRTLCVNPSKDPRCKLRTAVLRKGVIEKTGGYTTSLKADGIFHLDSYRATEEEKCSEASQTQKSPRAKCDLSDEGSVYTVEISGVLDQIVHSPGKSVSIYTLGSDKSPRSRFVHSRLLRRVTDWALKQQSWWETMNFSCTLLPSDSAPIELSSTDSPVLRNQDINNSMNVARTSLKSLLQKCPEIARSLCNTVYTFVLSNGNKESRKTSEIIVVESHGWQTIDMSERDYQRALSVILELEACRGFQLKPGEQRLLRRLQKATYRNIFLCLSSIENEADSGEELKMFELGASLTNDALQRRKIEKLNTIIANQQAEIVVQSKSYKGLERSNQMMVNSTVEVRKKQEKIEEQRREFNEKRLKRDVIIKGLQAKIRCLEKPSPFVEMYKKSEERRKEEVAQLNKQIKQLQGMTEDQEQNINSLQEVCEVLRASDAIQAERKLNICQQSFEVVLAEIRRKLSSSRDKEKEYIGVIEQLGEAVGCLGERAERDKEVMKNLLKYSEKFKEEIEVASCTIEELSADNESLRQKLRSTKKDLRDHSAFKKEIEHLHNNLKVERARLKESEEQKRELVKMLDSNKKDMKHREKESEKRNLDLEKSSSKVEKWRKEAEEQRKIRKELQKEIRALEKNMQKAQKELENKEKNIEKERKEFTKQMTNGMKNTAQLQTLQKEVEMQKQLLSDMTTSKKEVVSLLKEEKEHLQKENSALQTKLDSQQVKILELQKSQVEATALSQSRVEPDDQEMTSLKSKVVELTGRQSLFITKVGKLKEKNSNLKKENARLLAELNAREGSGEAVNDQKMQNLTKELKEMQKMFKKSEGKRGNLKNELKITKDLFADIEKENSSLRKKNKSMRKELEKLRNNEKMFENKVKGDGKNATDEISDLSLVESTPKLIGKLSDRSKQKESTQENPNYNPGSPAKETDPTPAIRKHKGKRKLLYKRKHGLITASKTSGASASSFFKENVCMNQRSKDKKSKKRKQIA